MGILTFNSVLQKELVDGEVTGDHHRSKSTDPYAIKTEPPKAEDVKFDLEAPLGSEFTIWQQLGTRLGAGPPSDYSDNTKQISDITTMREFWNWMSRLPQPSELLPSTIAKARIAKEAKEAKENEEGEQVVAVEADKGPLKMFSVTRSDPPDISLVDGIMIFRKGVRPMWEDQANAKGGHFEFKFKYSEDQCLPSLDEYWNNLAIALVSGTLDRYGVTGVRLMDKVTPKGFGFIRYELWYGEQTKEGLAELRIALIAIMNTSIEGEVLDSPLVCDNKSHHRHT